MEKAEKVKYEAPTVMVVEIKTEAAILQASKPDYDSEEW